MFYNKTFDLYDIERVNYFNLIIISSFLFTHAVPLALHYLTINF